MFGTDVHGTVTFTTDGSDWEVVTERDGSIDAGAPTAPAPEPEPQPEPEPEPEPQ